MGNGQQETCSFSKTTTMLSPNAYYLQALQGVEYDFRLVVPIGKGMLHIWYD